MCMMKLVTVGMEHYGLICISRMYQHEEQKYEFSALYALTRDILLSISRHA